MTKKGKNVSKNSWTKTIILASVSTILGSIFALGRSIESKNYSCFLKCSALGIAAGVKYSGISAIVNNIFAEDSSDNGMVYANISKLGASLALDAALSVVDLNTAVCFIVNDSLDWYVESMIDVVSCICTNIVCWR